MEVKKIYTNQKHQISTSEKNSYKRYQQNQLIVIYFSFKLFPLIFCCCLSISKSHSYAFHITKTFTAMVLATQQFGQLFMLENVQRFVECLCDALFDRFTHTRTAVLHINMSKHEEQQQHHIERKKNKKERRAIIISIIVGTYFFVISNFNNALVFQFTRRSSDQKQQLFVCWDFFVIF